MKKRIRIGIIGCGAIGQFLARSVVKKFSKELTLVALADKELEKAVCLKQRLRRRCLVTTSIEKLVSSSDVIIEAASAGLLKELVPLVLNRKGKHLLVLSVGGLLRLKGYQGLITRHYGRLWIPSGAIAGIDGLLACAESKLKSVKLVTKKPPEGLQGAPYFLTHRFPKLSQKEEKRVFKGNTFEAIKAFPQNVNVSAALSLAGLGGKKTFVEIWTSKAYTTNSHHIEIQSDSSTINIDVENKPFPENLKTSHLAALSALATLRRLINRVQIA